MNAKKKNHPPPLCPLPEKGAVALVDKPKGPTSHDVVNRLRRVFGMRRVGHAGTLDPMATGLLVVGAGNATRLLQFMSGLDKDYDGRVTLGAVSDTGDAEGEISPTPPDVWPDRAAIEREMSRFLGKIEQLPPAHSAIKVDGRHLYDYARNGETAPVQPRSVEIASFEILEYSPPYLTFRSSVSSGTYIRSLAMDLGQALGCGGYLSALRRTRVGPFDVGQAVDLEAIESEPRRAEACLLGPGAALPHLARVEIGPEAAIRLKNGIPFRAKEILSGGEGEGESLAAVYDSAGDLLAVCQIPEASDENALWRSLRVFN